MPINFRFELKDGSDAICLQKADDLIREKMGLIADPERWSTEYSLIIELGVSATFETGFATQETVEKVLAESKSQIARCNVTGMSDEDYTNRLIETARDMLYREYSFSAWRSSF